MYKKTILENGIRVITETMPEARSVTMGVLVNVGPQNETPGQYGLAHLVEHMMFQGTGSRSAMQIARLMDIAGGHIGGFTTRDYTGYAATVLDDHHTYTLDLLGDILLNSTFPPDSLEREKEAVLREIDAGNDAPDEHAHTLLKSLAWPNHTLGRPITGQADTITKLTREDVIYFTHQHYTPDRIVIAAAGHIDHHDFTAQVRDAFWRMMGEDEPASAAQPAYHSGLIIETTPVSQVYFSLGIRAYPYAHPNRYALHILNNALGGGISSRLFRRIREERGLVYDIGSEYHAYRNDGMLVIEGSTAPEYLHTVLGLTLVEMWQLAAGAEPIDEDELWKSKMHIRGQHLIESENTSARMSRLATQELYFGRYIPAGEVLAEIEAVNIKQLKELANNALVDALNQVTLAIVGPETPEHYSFSSVEDLLAGFQ